MQTKITYLNRNLAKIKLTQNFHPYLLYIVEPAFMKFLPPFRKFNRHFFHFSSKRRIEF